MSSQVSPEQLGDATLQSVEHGGFPQDEHVASAAVPASALPKLLELVGRAREITKACVAPPTLCSPANGLDRTKSDRSPAKLPPMSMAG